MRHHERCSACVYWDRRDRDPKIGDCTVHAPVVVAGSNPQGRAAWPWTEAHEGCHEWEPSPDMEMRPDLLVASKKLADTIVEPVRGPGGKTMLYACRLCGANAASLAAIEHIEKCPVPAFLVSVLSCS